MIKILSVTKLIFYVLVFTLLFVACSKESKLPDPLIQDDFTKVDIYFKNGDYLYCSITDPKNVNLLIDDINKNSAEIYDVLWEVGPDGEMRFINDDETQVFAFFAGYKELYFSFNKHQYKVNFQIDFENLGGSVNNYV